ncbi:alpha/beta-hydrolase [Conidiobolus coronatus NRRL 28638]|uniref:Alpha/beta-hydrolase n=1 Tax=Conidiobolus coronatus (strain ATCC 28846 / CBS 209.66 / NRRL 28638) TaxID=796925 RepID=A0A137PBT1_CONC2|nr:alpha/beta-hydrolase [Conidiobolus coronatus NRRL 28638]|eukprot:KXN72401.1 alpha/beta-hydrolase [Conidiobolus coronatus NRRL 28638]
MRDMFLYSNAAYCDIQMISTWSCKQCKSADSSLVMSEIKQINDEYGNLFGYIGVNRNRIILAFRGTQNLPNVLTDVNYVLDKYKTKKGIEFGIHRGVKQAVESLLSVTIEHLKYFKGKYKNMPNIPIYITGHSLGGSLANLMTMRLEDLEYIKWENTRLYTFGQPRVGDQNYANYINSQSKLTYRRVVVDQDIFTNTPNRLLGYSHSGHLHFRKNNVEDKSCDKDVEQPRCYNFVNPATISHHTNYLGYRMTDNCVKLPVIGEAQKVEIIDFSTKAILSMNPFNYYF